MPGQAGHDNGRGWDDKEGVRGWRWWLFVRELCKHRLRLGNHFRGSTQFLEDADGVGLAFLHKVLTEGFVTLVCNGFWTIHLDCLALVGPLPGGKFSPHPKYTKPRVAAASVLADMTEARYIAL